MIPSNTSKRLKSWSLAALTLTLAACQPGVPALAPVEVATQAARPQSALRPPFSAPGSTVSAANTEAEATPPKPIPGEWIVTLRKGATPAPLMKRLAPAGYRLLGQLRIRGRYWLRMGAPEALGQAAADALAEEAEVGSVAPHMQLTTQQVAPFAPTGPDDPEFDRQWSHRTTELEAAWSATDLEAQSKVIVAVVDSGIDMQHEEFTGRIVKALNFTSVDIPDPITQPAIDNDGHGTHVAGIIGAAGNNQTGIAGVAWGVKLMACKVLNGGGGSDFNVMQGVSAAIHQPPIDGAYVRVINLSLGGNFDASINAAYADLYQEARDRGILIVGAAGNQGAPFVSSPANTPGGIAVGATREYLGLDIVDTYSNFGPAITLVAPGTEILSTYPTALFAEGYSVSTGTSMATPFVSGVAALVVAKYGEADYDPADTVANTAFCDRWLAHMSRSVDDIGLPGRDDLSGFGRLNARKALEPDTL